MQTDVHVHPAALPTASNRFDRQAAVLDAPANSSLSQAPSPVCCMRPKIPA